MKSAPVARSQSNNIVSAEQFAPNRCNCRWQRCQVKGALLHGVSSSSHDDTQPMKSPLTLQQTPPHPSFPKLPSLPPQPQLRPQQLYNDGCSFGRLVQVVIDRRAACCIEWRNTSYCRSFWVTQYKLLLIVFHCGEVTYYKLFSIILRRGDRVTQYSYFQSFSGGDRKLSYVLGATKRWLSIVYLLYGITVFMIMFECHIFYFSMKLIQKIC